MLNSLNEDALFRKVDCIRIPVSNLKDGLEFYRDKLGHEIIWRTNSSIGLKIPESEAELVIHTEQNDPETDIKVKSVDHATKRFVDAGGSIVKAPFDISIGRCVVVKDPWDNELVLLDSSKGVFKTNSNSYVIGLE